MWVCDPIDGTAQFASGVPVSTFSLALVHNGEPILGVIYNPFTKELYSAVKGSQAKLNNTFIKVSERSLREKSFTNYRMVGEC